MNIPLNIDWQQILLHMFNFVLLFGILYFLLYKPVKKFMTKRTEYYNNIDAEAKAKMEKAAAAEAEIETKIAQVDADIIEKRKAAQTQFLADKERFLKAAQNESDKILEKAKIEAQNIHDDMIRQTNNEIESMITAATEKILFPDTETAYDTFLDEVEGSADNE